MSYPDEFPSSFGGPALSRVRKSSSDITNENTRFFSIFVVVCDYLQLFENISQ